ncbi:unnamed protein product [Protopolystoma xenopodis]|uniref:Major facilitator superfamily (MFS) profile domain-containing protein n=1 Tax=Protopolystoma xenopodis TaxID=117903 RepID=A0A448XEY7_9PLAT|nr:unnamed protein product [Protopolystoma xenopodis]
MRGLYSEILGPSLIALRDLTNSNRMDFSSALSVRATGMFVGSVSWGVLADKAPRHRDFLLAVAIFLGGLTNILIPKCTDLPGFTAVMFAAGFGHGALTSSK